MSALRKSRTYPALQGHERAVLECVLVCPHVHKEEHVEMKSKQEG